MTAAPIAAPWAPRTGGRDLGFLSVETLIRQARLLLADRDETMSQARLSKTIRRYIDTGRGDVDFRTWFIAYADPTGETACRNVMKAQR